MRLKLKKQACQINAVVAVADLSARELMQRSVALTSLKFVPQAVGQMCASPFHECVL
jgi:hypothetical protein